MLYCRRFNCGIQFCRINVYYDEAKAKKTQKKKKKRIKKSMISKRNVSNITYSHAIHTYEMNTRLIGSAKEKNSKTKQTIILLLHYKFIWRDNALTLFVALLHNSMISLRCNFMYSFAFFLHLSFHLTTSFFLSSF